MNLNPIGDILLERGLITSRDLSQALKLQTELGGPVGQALLRLGALSEENLLDALSFQLDLPILTPNALPQADEAYDAAISRLGLRRSWLSARKCAVWADTNDKLINMTALHVLDPEIREQLENRCRRAGVDLKVFLSANPTLEQALSHMRPQSPNSTDVASDADTARLKEMAEEAPVIDFVNRIFATALKDNASDIHIEPFEHMFKVRYRIDGVLHERQSEPRTRFDAVASRVKLLSGMDIAERRLPQDGRQAIRFAGQDIDLRVSSVPGSWGESLVLRLLKKDGAMPDLGALGLDGHARGVLQSLLAHPNGVILVTGPTGSGKSTTLYQSLKGLNDGIRKIITIEDPVEYDMDGIIQIQTNANIDYTFARGLRAILRQDPDIIMVGEIRDSETATIAAQAALTGHLVLSTLHTNSALAAVARLVDIGLEPYMVASAVRGLVAQRLVRRLCEHCAEPVKNPEGEALIWSLIEEGSPLDLSAQKKPNWHDAKGCEHCHYTGYQGRVAIFEAAAIDDALSTDILEGVSLQHLVKTARSQGFVTLFEDGIMKARAGLTSLAEVERVCGRDRQLVDVTMHETAE